MRINRSTRYWLATGSLGLVALLIIRFIGEARHQPNDGSRRTYYLVMGGLLFVVLAIVAVLQAYYRRDRDSVVDESPLGSELAARGLIAADNHTPITVSLTATARELHTLADEGELAISADRLSGPVRTGDTVRLYQDQGNYQQEAYGVLDTIDGVNQRMIIKRLVRPPISHRADR